MVNVETNLEFPITPTSSFDNGVQLQSPPLLPRANRPIEHIYLTGLQLFPELGSPETPIKEENLNTEERAVRRILFSEKDQAEENQNPNAQTAVNQDLSNVGDVEGGANLKEGFQNPSNKRKNRTSDLKTGDSSSKKRINFNR